MSNWILCPLRNGLALTRAALKTFLQQDIGDVRVLFCDNLSQDGTVQWLTSLRDERIAIVYNSVPLSVAQSWNRMLRWTFNGSANHALVVNNDVLLRPDTYRHLVADGGQFVTTVGDNNPKCVDPPWADPDPEAKRPHPDFSCFLIRKECYERVGPFDEQFTGAYCEDGDYHIRMHRAGIEAYSLGLPFYHLGAGTLKNADQMATREIQKRADRNRELFRQKYGVQVGSNEYYELFTEAAAQSGTEPSRASEPASL